MCGQSCVQVPVNSWMMVPFSAWHIVSTCMPVSVPHVVPPSRKQSARQKHQRMWKGPVSSVPPPLFSCDSPWFFNSALIKSTVTTKQSLINQSLTMTKRLKHETGLQTHFQDAEGTLNTCHRVGNHSIACLKCISFQLNKGLIWLVYCLCYPPRN